MLFGLQKIKQYKTIQFFTPFSFQTPTFIADNL
jgi:hypothetical protein